MPPENYTPDDLSRRRNPEVVPRALRPGPLRLVLVGAGALGSAVAAAIATSPLSAIAIAVLVIDPDLLEPRNVALSRAYQEIYTQAGPAAFKRYKADLLAEAMRVRAAKVQWTAAATEIADLGWADLVGCDLIISCTDSALARVETAFAARTLGIPMLDGGLLSEGPQSGVTQGRVTWFGARRRAACYLCGLTEARRAELLRFAGANSLGCHPPAIGPAMGTYAEVPAAIDLTAQSLVQVLQTFAACPEADLFTAHSWAARVQIHEGNHHSERHELAATQDCPWHGRPSDALLAVAPDVPFRDVLRQQVSTPEAWGLEVSWPVCLRARGRSCGRSQRTATRLAALRRHCRCIQCGTAATLESLHTVSSVGMHDTEAERTPRQLGMPERHLYRLRPVFSPRTSSRSSR